MSKNTQPQEMFFFSGLWMFFCSQVEAEKQNQNSATFPSVPTIKANNSLEVQRPLRKISFSPSRSFKFIGSFNHPKLETTVLF